MIDLLASKLALSWIVRDASFAAHDAGEPELATELLELSKAMQCEEADHEDELRRLWPEILRLLPGVTGTVDY